MILTPWDPWDPWETHGNPTVHTLASSTSRALGPPPSEGRVWQKYATAHGGIRQEIHDRTVSFFSHFGKLHDTLNEGS